MPWAELRSPGAWAGLRNLAGRVLAGTADTGSPGRNEAVQVLQLAVGGTAEERW